MRKLHQRITQITVLPAGEPIFSEMGYTIQIQDEASGEHVIVRKNFGIVVSDQEIRIKPKEWSSIREAIDRMMAEISEWEEITTDTK